jgi:type I restriction enzyme, S subunit
MQSEWTWRPLGDLFHIHRESISPGAHPVEIFEHYSLPAFDESGGPAIQAGAEIESNKSCLSLPVVLVSKLNPRKPRVMLVTGNSSLRRCASTEWIPYAPQITSVDLAYYKWLFGSSGFSRQLEKVATGSTNSHVRVSPSETLCWNVPHPPIPEQRRIAEILDTLDEAIRKTEQVIAKLQQMKQGLLHDLLTRGIDENGELRDAERHPEQFKDSPLGRIPRGWEVRELGASVDILHGYAYDGAFFADRPLGPMLLTPGNFHREGGLYFTSTNTKWFAGKLPSGYILRGGDIVTVMTDLSPRTLILGSTVVLDEGQELLHNQRIGKVVAKSSADWDSTFLALQMSSDRFRRKVIAEATGTTVRHTSPGKMKANLVARPPLSEQAVSVGSVVSYGARIHFEASGLNKLRSLKQGLMEDLLTGRVRVKPEEAE